MDYLYILKNNLSEGYKIGRTRNYEQRFKQLSVGDKASVVALFSTIDAHDLELFLHREYKQFRVPQSEWFILNGSQLSSIVSYCHQVSNCLENNNVQKTYDESERVDIEERMSQDMIDFSSQVRKYNPNDFVKPPSKSIVEKVLSWIS